MGLVHRAEKYRAGHADDGVMCMRIAQNGVEIATIDNMIWPAGDRIEPEKKEGVFVTLSDVPFILGSVIDFDDGPSGGSGRGVVLEVVAHTENVDGKVRTVSLVRFVSGKYADKPDDPDNAFESGISCGGSVLKALEISPDMVRRFWIDIDVQKPTTLTLERLSVRNEPDGVTRRDVTHFGAGGWTQHTRRPVDITVEVHLLSNRTCVEAGCTVGEDILQALIGVCPSSRRLRLMFSVDEVVSANVDVLVRRGALREIVQLISAEKKRMQDEACVPDEVATA